MEIDTVQYKLLLAQICCQSWISLTWSQFFAVDRFDSFFNNDFLWKLLPFSGGCWSPWDLQQGIVSMCWPGGGFHYAIVTSLCLTVDFRWTDLVVSLGNSKMTPSMFYHVLSNLGIRNWYICPDHESGLFPFKFCRYPNHGMVRLFHAHHFEKQGLWRYGLFVG